MYPGVGWVLFRSKSYLPESLVFHDNYLGTGERSLHRGYHALRITSFHYQMCFIGVNPCMTEDTVRKQPLGRSMLLTAIIMADLAGTQFYLA